MFKLLLLIDKILFIFPRVLLNILFQPCTKFEKCLIDNIIKQINAPLDEILKEHFRKVNYVQRDADDRQIRMYYFVPFAYRWKRKNYFYPKDEEITICRFLIKFQNGDKLHGSFKSIDGVFAVINFNGRARQYRKTEQFEVSIKKQLRTNVEMED